MGRDGWGNKRLMCSWLLVGCGIVVNCSIV